MTTPNNTPARIVLHTMNEYGEELVTMVLTMPKFLVAEFNTHRSLSKNSASSRAIPHDKFRERVKQHGFIPTFMAHEKGMAANTPLDSGLATVAGHIWYEAMESMLDVHERLSEIGVSKGQANRLLEAFFLTEVISTGTRKAWDAFLSLRANPAAQTEIQTVAYGVKDALSKSEAIESNLHLPFSNPEDDLTSRIIMSVVNCARVSYLNHGGTQDPIEALTNRFASLVKMRHASPFEHQASSVKGNPQYNGNFGNFGETAFCQLRKVIELDGFGKVEKLFEGFTTPKELIDSA